MIFTLDPGKHRGHSDSVILPSGYSRNIGKRRIDLSTHWPVNTSTRWYTFRQFSTIRLFRQDALWLLQTFNRIESRNKFIDTSTSKHIDNYRWPIARPRRTNELQRNRLRIDQSIHLSNDIPTGHFVDTSIHQHINLTTKTYPRIQSQT